MNVRRCPACRYELRGSEIDRCPECGIGIDKELIERVERSRAMVIMRTWTLYGILGWIATSILSGRNGWFLWSTRFSHYPLGSPGTDWVWWFGITGICLIPIPALAIWRRRMFAMIYKGAAQRDSKRPRVVIRALVLGVPGALVGALSTAILVLLILVSLVGL